MPTVRQLDPQPGGEDLQRMVVEAWSEQDHVPEAIAGRAFDVLDVIGIRVPSERDPRKRRYALLDDTSATRGCTGRRDAL